METQRHTCEDCDIVTRSRDEIEAHERATGHEINIDRKGN